MCRALEKTNMTQKARTQGANIQGATTQGAQTRSAKMQKLNVQKLKVLKCKNSKCNNSSCENSKCKNAKTQGAKTQGAKMQKLKVQKLKVRTRKISMQNGIALNVMHGCVFLHILAQAHVSVSGDCPLSNRCLPAFDGSWPGGTATKHQFHMHVILGSILTLIMSNEAPLASKRIEDNEDGAGLCCTHCSQVFSHVNNE